MCGVGIEYKQAGRWLSHPLNVADVTFKIRFEFLDEDESDDRSLDGCLTNI